MLLIFAIMCIVATYGIVENNSIIFYRQISTMLNLVSFVVTLIVVVFCKFGFNVVKQLEISRFLYFCFIISCLSFFLCYLYIGLNMLF